MTDAKISEIYRKALGRNIAPHHVFEAKQFINFLFDELEVAGYLDPDGTFSQEEWDASADCEEVFKRPIWQE